MKRIPLIAVAALLLAGCAKRDESAYMAESPSNETMAAHEAPGPGAYDSVGGAAESQARKGMNSPYLASAPVPSEDLNKAAAAKAMKRAVIRNGTLSIRVDSVEKAEKKVGKLVSDLGGYIANTSSSDLAAETPSLSLSLKIPADQFEGTMDSLESLGTRLTKTTKTQDVTAELVDLDARLKIMRAQEDAFRNMLKKAAGQQEIMDIQSRIMDLRGQIESLAAQQKSLGDLASLSTIELTMQQSSVGAATAGDPNWSNEAWGTASSTLMSVGRGLGTVGIWLLLFAPLWVPAILLFRWILRNHRTVQPQP